MGHKFSAVTGARTDRYHEPGNAINEIWVGDVEVISRLPFGDSDLNQAGWPKGGIPKIPWKNFIIPMKRDVPGPGESDNLSRPLSYTQLAIIMLVIACGLLILSTRVHCLRRNSITYLHFTILMTLICTSLVTAGMVVHGYDAGSASKIVNINP